LAADREEAASFFYSVIRWWQLQQIGKLRPSVGRQIEQQPESLELLGIADYSEQIDHSVIDVVIDLDFAPWFAEQDIRRATKRFDVDPMIRKPLDEPFGVVGLPAVPSDRRFQPFPRPSKRSCTAITIRTGGIFSGDKKQFLRTGRVCHFANP
jgi:hypothetical protein